MVRDGIGELVRVRARDRVTVEDGNRAGRQRPEAAAANGERGP